MRWAAGSVGEFTIAIWDARDKTLFILRDHFGLRGCFVHDGPDWYVVASEPAQVLAIPGVPDDLDEYGIVDYISGYPVDAELNSIWRRSGARCLRIPSRCRAAK